MNQGRIFAVGIGPGGLDLLAPRAREVLERADVVVGYRPYLDLLGDLIIDKEVVSTGMRGEVARCQSAIAKARQGSMVAVVSSGDAGIYGMAGLLLELEENEIAATIKANKGDSKSDDARLVLLETNSLAAWLHENTIYAPGRQSNVGNANTYMISGNNGNT